MMNTDRCLQIGMKRFDDHNNLSEDAVTIENFLRSQVSSAYKDKAEMTPYKVITDKKPSLLNLRIFRCKACVYFPMERRDRKISNQLRPGIFVGSVPSNCYQIPIAEKMRCRNVVSIDVRFNGKWHTKKKQENIDEDITEPTTNYVLCKGYLRKTEVHQSENWSSKERKQSRKSHNKDYHDEPGIQDRNQKRST